MRSKFGAVATIVDGIRFASKAEARRYLELRMLEKAGKIAELELQPAFILVPPYTRADGTKCRGTRYVADFRYLDMETLRLVVEDVKGVKTAVYQLKKTHLEWKVPGLQIIEVKA